MSKFLYSLIRKSVQCEDRLEFCKLALIETEEVYRWLDQRRRGTVNVEDLFARFPELTDGELFYVFNYLDGKKKGVLTL